MHGVLCAVSLLFKIQPRSSRPPLVYLNKSNCCSFQTSASFLSSVSMVSSLMAALVISEMSGPYWCSRMANMLPSVNVLGSMSNFWPAAHNHCRHTEGLLQVAYVPQHQLPRRIIWCMKACRLPCYSLWCMKLCRFMRKLTHEAVSCRLYRFRGLALWHSDSC